MREEYSSSETIPVKDLKVTATYLFCSKNYEVQLSEGDFETNIAELDMSTPGEKIITVTYTDRGVTKTATVRIWVHKSSSGGSSTEPESGSTTETPTNPGGGSTSELPTQPGGGSTKEPPIQSGGGSASESAGQPETGSDNGNFQNSDDNSNKTVLVTKIKISGPSQKLAAGKKANTTLKWTSSNSKYATVSKTGKVKAKKAGKGKFVTITAVSTDGSNKKAKIKIKIK